MLPMLTVHKLISRRTAPEQRGREVTVGRPTDGVRELVQDRGLDWGCFAVHWGISWVETAGGLQGALRGLTGLG